jgi:minor histocompatibility antigen H13
MDQDDLHQTLATRVRQALGWLMNTASKHNTTNDTAAAVLANNVSDQLNATAASTGQEAAQFIDLDAIIISAQVVVSACLIIWLGAHGALRRPPSAAPSKGKSKKDSAKDDRFVEGFVASDAIMFPVLAGVVLVGLYYILKWLQDPDLVNKILRTYMSVMSTASLAKVCTDALQLLITLVFPKYWRDSSGQIWEVDPKERRHVHYEPGKTGAHSDPAAAVVSPFPGFLGKVVPARLVGVGWDARHLLTEQWTIRLAARGIGRLETKLRLSDVLGALLGVLITAIYYATNSPILSNFMGAALCYSSFSLLSPTSFTIGSLVLWGLFVYDIVMVFYT